MSPAGQTCKSLIIANLLNCPIQYKIFLLRAMSQANPRRGRDERWEVDEERVRTRLVFSE